MIGGSVQQPNYTASNTQELIISYQSMGMDNAEIRSILKTDGFAQETVDAAFRELARHHSNKNSQLPSSSFSITVAPERILQVCDMIDMILQSQDQLPVQGQQPDKDLLRVQLLDYNVTQQEFEAAWTAKFATSTFTGSSNFEMPHPDHLMAVALAHEDAAKAHKGRYLNPLNVPLPTELKDPSSGVSLGNYEEDDDYQASMAPQPGFSPFDVPAPARLDEVSAQIRTLLESGMSKQNIQVLLKDIDVTPSEFEMAWRLHDLDNEVANKPAAASSVYSQQIPSAVTTNAKPAAKPIQLEGLTVASQGIKINANLYSSIFPLLACKFVAYKEDVASDTLSTLIDSTVAQVGDLKPLDCIKQTPGISLVQNPAAAQRNLSLSLQVSFMSDDILRGLNLVIGNGHVTGAIITANGDTLGMRVRNSSIEIFDPHGNASVTGKDKIPYVKKFPVNNRRLLANFLAEKFPDDKSSASIEIWPLQNS